MGKIWVDPPGGWRYGFPKIYDPAKDIPLVQWLVKVGYPQREIDSCGDHFYMRQWAADDFRDVENG